MSSNRGLFGMALQILFLPWLCTKEDLAWVPERREEQNCLCRAHKYRYPPRFLGHMVHCEGSKEKGNEMFFTRRCCTDGFCIHGTKLFARP